MIVEAIVLAGGKGRRLQTVVSDVPKPMADIQGKPFLEYLLKWLEFNKMSRVIVSTGYKSDLIQSWFGERFGTLAIDYSREDAPLGTGGAIKKGLQLCLNENPFVINGDTFFNIDLSLLRENHIRNSADITIAVKEMHNFDRYGTVIIRDGVVVSFCEKKHTEKGFINAGVYCISHDAFKEAVLPDEFSFETDFLKKQIVKTCAVPFDGSFIDIGTPSDYEAAQKLVPLWAVI